MLIHLWPCDGHLQQGNAACLRNQTPKTEISHQLWLLLFTSRYTHRPFYEVHLAARLDVLSLACKRLRLFEFPLLLCGLQPLFPFWPLTPDITAWYFPPRNCSSRSVNWGGSGIWSGCLLDAFLVRCFGHTLWGGGLGADPGLAEETVCLWGVYSIYSPSRNNNHVTPASPLHHVYMLKCIHLSAATWLAEKLSIISNKVTDEFIVYQVAFE